MINPRWLALGLLSAATPLLPAQVPADLAAGFELLVEAGLPDTRGWVYGSFESSWGGGYDRLESMSPPPPKGGNAWLQAKPGADGLTHIVTGNVTVGVLIKYVNGDSDEDARKEMARVTDLGEIPVIGKFQPADEPKDAAAFAAWLKAALLVPERKEELLDSGAPVTQIFYRAAHWYRRGLMKEAGEICHALMEAVPQRQRLLESVTGGLASARARAAVSRLSGTLDWKALENELTKLLGDFPVGWAERPLAERLLTQVKPRAAGESLKPLPGDFPLTAEQQAWWDKLVTIKPSASQYFNVSAVGTAWVNQQLGDSTANDRSPAVWQEEPWKQGKDWDWIQVMAAALGDETPVPLALPSGGDMSGYESYSSDPFASESPSILADADLEEAWQRWHRPPTRGELAEQFLKEVLPNTEGLGDSAPLADRAAHLRTVTKTWNTTRQGKSGLELARLYLAGASRDKQQAAAAVVIKKGTEQDLKMMEEALLADPQSSQQLVRGYLQRQKGAAKEFWAKYKTALMAALIKDYARDEPDPKKAEAMVPEYATQQLAVLENLVSGRGFAEVLEDYVAGKGDERTLQQSLGMSDEEPGAEAEEAAKAMLAAIKRIPAKDAERKFKLLSVFARIQVYGQGREEKAGAPAAWIIDGLRELIDQDGDLLVQGWGGEPLPFRNSLYMMVEQLWDIEAAQMFYNKLGNLPPEDSLPIFEARAKARLSGQPVPELPAPDQVPEARRTEIANRVKAPGTDWSGFVKGLTMAEKMVAQQELQKIPPTPEWRTQMLKVSRVTLGQGTKGKEAAWQGLAGATVNAKTVESALTICREAVAAGAPSFSAAIQTDALRTGMKLHAREVESQGGMGRAMDIAGWIKKSSAAGEAPFTALSVVWWMEKHQPRVVVWQLGKDGKWTNLDTAALPEAWMRGRQFGETVPADDFAATFDKALQEWNPEREPWHLQIGVWPVPPREPKQPE